MALELTEKSTAEEVKEYAEQVVKDVETERAGEKKGDAQITTEHAAPAHEHTVAKGDETAADDKGDEKAGESWLSDDLKAEAEAAGLEESDLTDFTSREELERALRLFDKKALEAGRKAQAEGESGRNEKGQFVKKEADPKPEGKKEGRYEMSEKFKEMYDEEIVGELSRMRDHYESRLEAVEARFAESDAKAAQQQFDSLVDSLGHADLFGKTDKEDAKQLQRRKDLHLAVQAQMIGLEQLGRPTELTESLVGRVARMVFAEDLGKKDLKNLTRKISRQSDGRQGGGATRPQDPREDPRDEADRLYREMSGVS